MFLKRLEMSGFKSFPSKTVLEFPFGVISVVGPNGSGKSNVADALRWVMGEQSMLRLRSKKGEDLIFNGTATKPRMSKGEVTLSFDNKDRAFPFEFDEVSIGRKVYRDGLNQYFINGSEVRLKDIAEVIAKAKLGLKGYTIINQGMGDLILNSSALERREIFEEALGLKEFQIKKKDALDKLAQTQVNCETAKKLIEEIEPHLKFLKRQVTKLEKREEIAAVLKDLEEKYFSVRWLAIGNEKKSLTSELAQIDKDIDEAQKKFTEIEKKIAEQDKGSGSFFDDMRKEEEKINELEKTRSTMLQELGKLEGLLEAGVKEIKSHHVSAKTLLDMLQAIEKDISLMLESTFDPEGFKLRLGTHLESIRAVLKENNTTSSSEQKSDPLREKKKDVLQSIEAIDLKIKGLREQITKIAKENQAQRQEFSNLHSQLRIKEHELGDLRHRRNRADLAMHQCLNDEAQLKEFFGVAFEDLQKENKSKEYGNDFDIQHTRKEIERLRVRLEMTTEIDPETQKEYDATNQRYEFLTIQVADLEQSMKNLHEVVVALEGQINGIFDSAFDKINDSFNHYFKLLFKGGKASLYVIKNTVKPINEEGEQEQVPEAGGIEIRAELPGKKIKGLNMLSGGERALTSIALLFALVSTSPPPFMVLDEIDAPLDESNSLRFIDILQELKKNTQFVIVTHNREVMKEADVLYGVTMEEEGVSKLLSLQLQSAEEYSR